MPILAVLEQRELAQFDQTMRSKDLHAHVATDNTLYSTETRFATDKKIGGHYFIDAMLHGVK